MSEDEVGPVLSEGDAAELRERWQRLQARFVDSPQGVVEEADKLVADVFEHVTRTFAREREALEEQWQRGDEASTEDLRIALRRYRSFFERLLAA